MRITRTSGGGWEFEGSWEDAVAHADEFHGKSVVIRVLPAPIDTAALSTPANQQMREAYEEIKKLHEHINPVADEDTLRYLREARSGAMYGLDGCE